MSQDKVIEFPSEIPLQHRILTKVDKYISLIFDATVLSGKITNTILTIIFAIFTSSILWNYSRNLLVNAGIAFLIFLIISILSGLLLNTILRFAFGRPTFENVWPIQKALYRLSLVTSKETVFKTKPEDEEKIREWWSLYKAIWEQTFKIKYMLLIYGKTSDPTPDDFEESWRKTWGNMQNYRISGISFKDALSDDNYDFPFLLLRHISLFNLILPLILVYEVIMIILFVGYLNNAIQLSSILQIGLIICFFVIIYLYTHHNDNYQEINLDLLLDQSVTVQMPQDLIGKISAFKPDTIYLQNIMRNKNYYFYIITNFIRTSSVFVSYNTLIFCLSAGITTCIGILFLKIDSGILFPLLYQFFLGAALIGIGFILCGYVFFWLLLHLRAFAAPFVSAIILGLSPFVLNFFSTGLWDFSDFSNTIMAVVLTLTGLITTTVAEVAKTDVSEDD